MTIAIISHPECLLHDIGDAHPEQPARIQVIDNALFQSPLSFIIKRFDAPLATTEQLAAIHDPEYVESIFKLSPSEGIVSLDADTIMTPHTLSAALRAAGAVIQAVDLVMSAEVQAAFCNIRPPGHHAERAKAMGFCIFNNVAAGIAHALQKYKLKRVAIIDFDVHHGNGTQDIFHGDKRVLLCSSFQYPFYPFSEADTVSNHIINIPLPAGTGGREYRAEVEQNWLEPLQKFSPELVFFSAGFDGHVQDSMSNINLNETDYAWLTRRIKQIAMQSCQGRMISSLEGGYALEILGSSVVAHVSAMSDEELAFS